MLRCNFGVVIIDSMGPAEEQDLFDSLIAKASSRQYYPPVRYARQGLSRIPFITSL
jgi:hypothetical protein